MGDGHSHGRNQAGVVRCRRFHSCCTPTAKRIGQQGNGRLRRRGLVAKRAEEKMIVEGAWIVVVAAAVFLATIMLVLVVSGKLYNPDRSHE